MAAVLQPHVRDVNGSYHGAYREDEASARYKLPRTRDLRLTKTIDVSAGDVEKKREELRVYFHNTFEVYERVYECLNSDESYTIQPVHKLRHPLIFYLGHTACFYLNKLVVAGLTTRINPAFEEMFAVGVDEMSWDDLNPGHYNWPTVEAVWQYRALVRDRVDSLFDQFKLELPMTFERSTCSVDRAFYWTILMGIEHERIHLETASVHVRELPMRLVHKHAFWAPCRDTRTAPVNELVPVAGGTVRVGRPLDSPIYGWDVDYADKVTASVSPFQASKYLVTNAEFFEFVQDQGYATRKYWDDEGWNWVSWKRPEHPWFWVKHENSFLLRTQVDEIPLPWDWPCEVNHLEARAFTRWKSEKTGLKVRLPTEFEWLLLHDRYIKVDQHEWEFAPGNVNLEYFASSCPVTRFQHGDFFDIIGNAWQHTETPVYPYKGYKTHPYYDDFSMPTFDGRHYCMKGGTWISTGNEATRDARYAFRRHFFQFIGIRYVVGEPVDEEVYLRDVLGMDPEVDAIAEFAYKKPIVDFVPVFPEQLSTVVLDAAAKHFGSALAEKTALDLYCGAGRLTFELSPHVAKATGVDWSARRLQPAFAMKERGTTSYSVVDGDTGKRTLEMVNASSFPWAGTRDRVTFYQADPSNLHAHLDNFDIIVAWNVLEQTYKPSAVIPHLVSRLTSGGLLVLASSYHFAAEVPQEYRPIRTENDHTTTMRAWITHNVPALRSLADPVDLTAVFPIDSRAGSLRRLQVTFWTKA